MEDTKWLESDFKEQIDQVIDESDDEWAEIALNGRVVWKRLMFSEKGEENAENLINGVKLSLDYSFGYL